MQTSKAGAALVLAFAAFYFWRAGEGLAARCGDAGTPALQALYLSIKNGLVVFGGTRDARINQAYPASMAVARSRPTSR